MQVKLPPEGTPARRPRQPLSLRRVLTAAAAVTLAAGPTWVAQPAAAASPDDTTIVFGDDMLPPPAPPGPPPAHAPSTSDTDINAAVVGDGFTTFDWDGYRPRFRENLTIRLVASGEGNVEILRAAAQSAANQINAATGTSLTVAGGQISDRDPADGEIVLRLSSSSPCTGNWIGCGGPRNVRFTPSGLAEINAGWATVRTNIVNYSSTVLHEVTLHELGHTLGLNHHDSLYQGQQQVMSSVVLNPASSTYRAGDLNGFRYLWPGPLQRPANDNFSAAATLTGETASANGSTLNATQEPGEPAHSGGTGSIWYRWTAPAGGQTTISTAGSNFDTTLGVYTGSNVSALTQVAANDDHNGSTSQVTFTAAAGTTYRIAVAGWGGRQGTTRISVTLDSRPANDAFANAQTITGNSGGVNGSNIGATADSGAPGLPGSGIASVWYRWTPTASGETTMTTSNATFDTVLGVHTGSSVTNLTVVAGNDDYDGGSNSRAVFYATAGTTYWIAVAGYGIDEGTFRLTWNLQPGPVNDNFERAIALAGNSGSTTGDSTGATLQTGETRAVTDSGATVWWTWTPIQAGTARVNTAGSNFDTTLGVWTGSSLTALTQVAVNDDVSGALTSAVQFDARANTTYRIAVGGYADATGTITLTYNVTAPPPTTTTTTTTPPPTTTPPRGGGGGGGGGTPTTTPTTTPATTSAPATTVAPPAVTQPGAYTPIVPERVFDTRPGEAAPGPKGKLAAGGTVTFTAPEGATAVAINVTITETEGPGHVTVWPGGEPAPATSMLNVTGAAQTRANLVIAPVGANGTVNVRTSVGAHLIADISGYYTPATGGARAGRFVPVTPHRAFDTRDGSPLGDRRWRNFTVAGVGPVPADGVAAVVVNLTATESAGAGYVVAYSAHTALPYTSTTNLSGPNATSAGLAIVPIYNGEMAVYTSTSVHVIGDIVGYITDSSAARSTAGLYQPISPARLNDTRDNGGPHNPGETRRVRVAGRARIPDDAVGFAGNLTYVLPAAFGYLTMWPAGRDQPWASSVNAGPSDVRANAVIGALGGGRVDVYALAAGDVIVDATGYFTG